MSDYGDFCREQRNQRFRAKLKHSHLCYRRAESQLQAEESEGREGAEAVRLTGGDMRCAACGYEGPMKHLVVTNYPSVECSESGVEVTVLYVCPSCGTVRAE